LSRSASVKFRDYRPADEAAAARAIGFYRLHGFMVAGNGLMTERGGSGHPGHD
jgi:hypothetical protein